MNFLTKAPSFYLVEMMLPLSIIIFDYNAIINKKGGKL